MNESKETNISVVVRVRPRNAREIRENSAAIITTPCTKSREVHVKAGSSDHSKIYTFDKVFGPDADQMTVFEDVVRPMLDEVLMGYNCTIFAYGQTGTGKTYTMEGDLDKSLGRDAGIIPRTLQSLFDILESDTSEFSVRVSFLELYNEELKDLLSAEDDIRKLRIFEDLNKKGAIVIQNLEEVLVKNATDVISIMQKGSVKRQTASTKMNEVSSRSHCIFSITVHIKEATPDGEELLKVGKLNLVDLAGSENIGRSGAENKRAKEAGMINQSLLTLGRVINALVDRSPHVPYRESKLTRLLQDSLGGRTKTCIIAAISPAKCNIEESLSTLEYAHRAKNIRNKPEINQKMTKRALIKEYLNEIERLKADLLATREKNGIFLSPETYESLMSENEGRKSSIDEMTRSITAKEQQIKQLEIQHQKQVDLFNETSERLDKSIMELDVKRKELNDALDNLRELRQQLIEQTILTKAHANTEKNLNQVAVGLVGTLEENMNDMGLLHEKIEKKEGIQLHNIQTFTGFQQTLMTHLEDIKSSLSEFHDSTNVWFQDMNNGRICHLKRKHELLYQTKVEFEKQFGSVENMRDVLKNDYVETIHSQISSFGTCENILKCIPGTISEIQKVGQETFNENISMIRESIMSYERNVLGHVNEIKQMISRTFENVNGYLEASMDKHQRISRVVQDVTESEVLRLRKENQALKSLVLKEREKKEVLKKRMRVLFDDVLEQVDENVDGVINGMSEIFEKSTRESVSVMDGLKNDCGDIGMDLFNDACVFTEELEKENGDVDRKMECLRTKVMGIEKLSEENCDSLKRVHADYDCLVGGLVGSQVKEMCVIQDDAVKQLEMSNERISCSDKEFMEFSKEWKNSFVNEVEEMRKEDDDFDRVVELKTNEHNGHVKKLESNVQRVIIAKEQEIRVTSLQEYEATGKTPKRKRLILPTWQLTKRHDEIIKLFRDGEYQEEVDENENLPKNPVRVDSGYFRQENEGKEDEKMKSRLPRFSKTLKTVN